MLNMKEMSIFRESITYDDLEVNYPGRFKKSTWEANTLKDKDNQKVRLPSIRVGNAIRIPKTSLLDYVKGSGYNVDNADERRYHEGGKQ